MFKKEILAEIQLESISKKFLNFCCRDEVKGDVAEHGTRQRECKSPFFTSISLYPGEANVPGF
jgi:hypothetical protein